MNTYTITTSEGYLVSTGNSLNDAAAAILTTDDREFDIRADEGGGFTIWSRHQTANERWGATIFRSFKDSREDATQEMFTAVINSRFDGDNEAILDESYAQMMYDLEAESDE